MAASYDIQPLPKPRKLTGTGGCLLAMGAAVAFFSFLNMSEGSGFHTDELNDHTFPSFALIAGIFVLAVGFVMLMTGIATEGRK